MSFPKDRRLTPAEEKEWMRVWLQSRAVGWEIYGLSHVLMDLDVAQTGLSRTWLLESALVHARCLSEFLVGRPNAKDKNLRRWKGKLDVTPQDMLTTWDPTTHLASTFSLLSGEQTRIDQALAHISKGRVGISRVTWDLAPLSRALLDGFGVFIAELRTAGRDFHADCLEAWLGICMQHLAEAKIDLNAPIDVASLSSVLFITPMGESSGRAAALMQRATST